MSVKFNIKSRTKVAEEKTIEDSSRTKATFRLVEQYEEDQYLGEVIVGENTLAVVKRGDSLIAGAQSNGGVFEDYISEYDETLSLDENLQNFVSEIEADVNGESIGVEEYKNRFTESKKRLKEKFSSDLEKAVAEAKAEERASILATIKEDLREYNEMIEAWGEHKVAEALKENEVKVEERLATQKREIFKKVYEELEELDAELCKTLLEDLEEMDSELVKTLTEDLKELEEGIDGYISDDRVVTTDEDEELVLDDEGNVVSNVVDENKEVDECSAGKQLGEGEEFDDIINQKNIDVDDVRDALTDLEGDVDDLRAEDFEAEDFLTDLGMEDFNVEDFDFGEDFGAFDLEDGDREFLIESIKNGKIKTSKQLKKIVESFRDKKLDQNIAFKMKAVFEKKENAIMEQANKERLEKKALKEEKLKEELSEHDLFKLHFIDRDYM